METSLPLIFMGLMGLAMLLYVVLDGFDLGVGALLGIADDADKDTMIASIGPFWDANETWLVLGVGLLLVAFPAAHGLILGSLYLPVLFMLIGLILRGVAFDFRVKARVRFKHLWDRVFTAGSVLAGFSQGYMLGLYITGFRNTPLDHLFAIVTGACLVFGYAFLGCGWLLIKTSGRLQRDAIAWAGTCLLMTAVGVVAISALTPLVSEWVRDRWFTMPGMLALMIIPLVTTALFVAARLSLSSLRKDPARGAWIPFACAVGIFVLSFVGLAYSLYPYIVVDKLTVWDAATSTPTLKIIGVGAAITLPVIVGYTIFAYRVFWGKAKALSYD
ncbi:MAG: cytochrome bd ubiquinol oxidase subunit II [Lysobacteraceae bacterium]|nr:MAG: cytochrome bd ubiquinol oxidase subunit II [Xanthomonadaceae bacterium]